MCTSRKQWNTVGPHCVILQDVRVRESGDRREEVRHTGTGTGCNGLEENANIYEEL